MPFSHFEVVDVVSRSDFHSAYENKNKYVTIISRRYKTSEYKQQNPSQTSAFVGVCHIVPHTCHFLIGRPHPRIHCPLNAPLHQLNTLAPCSTVLFWANNAFVLILSPVLPALIPSRQLSPT